MLWFCCAGSSFVLILEIIRAYHWEGVRLPLDFPEFPRTRNFSHCGFEEQSRGSPEVSQTCMEVRGFLGSSPDLLSLGSLTPSYDSQEVLLMILFWGVSIYFHMVGSARGILVRIVGAGAELIGSDWCNLLPSLV